MRAHRATPPRTTGAGGCSRSAARGAPVDLDRGRSPRPREEDAGRDHGPASPIADGEAGRRASAAILRELESGFPALPSRSGAAARPPTRSICTAPRNEALLAVNVVEGDTERTELAFEQTGTYQLLLPHMSDPAELQRFYDETVRPLVAYDEQYETDLLGTLSTFLDCDANVNATAARLITHRHTIRYRFERVRELTGLDVSSTDGREKLSLGLKAMRVLGIAAPRGPATEPGAEGGRVPR